MSCSVQFVSNNVPGYGQSEGRTFPCSGISGRAISLSLWSSRSCYRTISCTNFALLKCTSRGMFTVCRAGSGGYRRNPEFSRQNRFSRNRNRQNEERDGSESFEEPEMFSSKNGPLLSISGTPKFQATATPGPREKEIVELFRKVQAQLRERAAVKEEKKKEDLPGQGKESETVDSLLKLLRKHTTQQGKKNSSGASNKDFIFDQSKQNGAFDADESTISLSNTGKDETQEHETSSFTRPVSNFRRRSPVPRVKFQPLHSDSFTETYISHKRETNEDEPEIENEPKLEIEPVLGFSDDRDVFDEISEEESSDVEDDYSDDDAEEEEPIAARDFNAMKLTELRTLAKSRGLKGFSKLKKSQLIELLSGGSI